MTSPAWSICVFCGSSDDVAAQYVAAARDLGRAIGQRGLTLVYGGGGTGMMKALADGALAAGGRVIGVLTEQFDQPALRYPALSVKHVVPTMHQRKALMGELSEAFVALPGGLGTLDELFEVLAWAQLGLHRRPIGLLNVHGYYDPLLAVIQRAREEGFLDRAADGLLLTEAEPHALLGRLDGERPRAGLERGPGPSAARRLRSG